MYVNLCIHELKLYLLNIITLQNLKTFITTHNFCLLIINNDKVIITLRTIIIIIYK
jgi:hypothetical protein